MSDSTPSFFEGTEKKFELVLDGSLPSLRRQGRSFWSRVVERARAEIVSAMSNAHCDAYLLSESSLFVYDHRMVMITCGQTRLPAAVLQVLDHVPAEQVNMFFYERKNEVFPHAQPTSFFEDVGLLNEHLPGKAFQFGEEDEHHLYLFHLDRPFQQDEPDATFEILMYGLDRQVRAEFGASGSGRSRQRLGLEEILPGFQYDDYYFQPGGYSLNAIRDDEYMTIHVTPEKICSYASFETNVRFDHDFDATLRKVLEIFRPRSFDVISWELAGETAVSEHGYTLKAHVAQELTCGYRVRFMNFYRPQPRVRRALELPLGPARPESEDR